MSGRNNQPGTGNQTRGTSQLTDPLMSLHFYVQIDGITEAVFSELSGLEITTKTFEQPDGGRNDHVVKLLGPTTVSDITLRNGLTTSTALWDWYLQVIRGPKSWPADGIRKQVSIVMVDQQGRETRRWSFEEALPIRWQAPTFNANQSTAAIQTLTLTHRGLSRAR